MKTVNKANRSVVMAGAIATLAVAAMGFAGSAQARDNVYWSVGVGTPGAVVNVGNVGYPQPVYVQPQPVYVQPAPVYVRPQPVFVRPQPVYLAPEPVYYERHHRRHHRHNGGYYERDGRDGYGSGYGQVYYQRDGRDGYDGNRHDGRR